MKRKLKKVLLMVSLVLMMGLVGCGVKWELIAHFVGRQVDPSADIRVMAKVKDNVTFPKKLYGCYMDIMSPLLVEQPNNYVYFNDDVKFYFAQKPFNGIVKNNIYFDETYSDLVLEFNGKRYVRGTLSNIEVDKSTIKLYEVDIELNGVSGNFKYNRNAFTLSANFDFDGYTDEGEHIKEKNIDAPLYGSFYYFSDNLRYFQISSNVRGYFVDVSALSEKRLMMDLCIKTNLLEMVLYFNICNMKNMKALDLMEKKHHYLVMVCKIKIHQMMKWKILLKLIKIM